MSTHHIPHHTTSILARLLWVCQQIEIDRFDYSSVAVVFALDSSLPLSLLYNIINLYKSIYIHTHVRKGRASLR